MSGVLPADAHKVPNSVNPGLDDEADGSPSVDNVVPLPPEGDPAHISGRHRYLPMPPAFQYHEYAIEWTEPDDMAGTITRMDDPERAQRILRIAGRLPGERVGRVVVRTVSFSDYEPVCEDIEPAPLCGHCEPVDDIRTILAREADEVEAAMDAEEAP